MILNIILFDVTSCSLELWILGGFRHTMWLSCQFGRQRRLKRTIAKWGTRIANTELCEKWLRFKLEILLRQRLGAGALVHGCNRSVSASFRNVSLQMWAVASRSFELWDNCETKKPKISWNSVVRTVSFGDFVVFLYLGKPFCLNLSCWFPCHGFSFSDGFNLSVARAMSSRPSSPDADDIVERLGLMKSVNLWVHPVFTPWWFVFDAVMTFPCPIPGHHVNRWPSSLAGYGRVKRWCQCSCANNTQRHKLGSVNKVLDGVVHGETSNHIYIYTYILNFNQLRQGNKTHQGFPARFVPALLSGNEETEMSWAKGASEKTICMLHCI